MIFKKLTLDKCKKELDEYEKNKDIIDYSYLNDDYSKMRDELLDLAKKEGVDAATLGAFTFSYTYTYSTASVNSKGQEGSDLKSLTLSPKQTISANKLDAFIQTANETPLLGIKVLYDAHGVRTITNWE